MAKIILPILICIATQCSAVAATEQWRRLDLPASVAVDEDLRSVPDGWRTVKDDRPHVLASVTFFDGRPEDLASLVYDREAKRKDRITRTWRFDPGWQNGAWLQLGYSATSVTLARRLPSGAAECRVEFDRTTTVDGFEQIKSIECR